MALNKFAAQWFEMEPIFNAAVAREKAIDLRKNVDWDQLEQIALGAAACAGCSLMESAQLKGTNSHVKLIFELRNAFVHNGCDISKNYNKNALNLARYYLQNSEHTLLSANIGGPFFSFQGNLVKFNSNLLFAIRLCLI